MFLPFLRSLVHRPAQTPRRKGRPAGRARFRPRLEAFEDRTLPSTVTWTNAAGGAWETAGNWSGGALPGPADDVQINTLNAGATVTHASDTTAIHSLTVSATQGTLAVTGGSLTLAAASSVADALRFTGGTIAGPGDLTLSGPFTWTGGTMSGSGNTNVNGASALSGSDWKWLVGRTLNNAGTLTWTGAGFIHGVDGAVINNQSGASFAAQTDSEFCVGGTASSVFNNLAGATFRKTVATGTTVNLWVLNNSGTVDLQSGALANYAGGTDGGAFTVAAPATLAFNGGYHNLTAASSVTGAGGVTVSNGAADFRGTYGLTGTTTVSGGTANFISNTTLGAAVLSGGTLTGPAAVTVTGLFTWTGGTLAGTGRTNANGGLAISGGNSKTLDGRTLNNAGAATWADTGSIYGYNGAVFNNQAGATFTVTSDQGFYWQSGDTVVFNNAGTFVKTASSDTTVMQLLFNNSGTVDVQTGAVTLSRGGSSSGTFTPEAGAGLSFAGGYHNLTAASSVAGAGDVTFADGVTDVAGTYNVTGSTTVTGGTANFTGTITSLGGPLSVSGGTANVARDVTVDTLNQSGGTLTGRGTVTVNTALSWTGGTMNDAGTTALAATGTLAIGGADKTLDGRTLTNAGTGTWTGGNINGYNGAVFNNQAGATFTVTSDQAFYSWSGDTVVFNNAGTVLKSASSDVTTFGGLFNNSGTLDVQTGTVVLAAGGSSGGTFTPEAGATLNFAGGYHNLTAASSVAGAGAVVFSGGTTDVTGTYNVTGSTAVTGYYAVANFEGTVTSLGGPLTITNGTANFVSGVAVDTLNLSGGTLSGPGTVTVNTALNWSGGTMSDAGTTSLAAGGTLAISGTAAKYLDGRTLTNGGTGTWINSGWIYASNGATFNNQAGATFAVMDNQTFYGWYGDTPVFNNAGTVTKSASSGTTTIQAQFNNTGTVDVQTGTIALTAGGTSPGTFTAEAGAALNFAGGYHLLGGTAVVNGAGAVTFSGGQTDVAPTGTGTYNVTGSTSVTGGTVNFDGNLAGVGTSLTVTNGVANFVSSVAVNTLNLSVGTLTGRGTVTVNTALNWTSGTMSDAGTTAVAAGATLTISSVANKYLDGRTLTNAGTGTWKNTGPIYTSNGATFNNQAGATLTVRDNQAFYWWYGASPVFNNAGTLTKTASSGTTTFQGEFNNTGTVNVQTGAIALAGGGTSTGAFALTAGTTLDFAGGSHSLTAASAVSGAGSVVFDNSTTYVLGTYNLSGGTTVTGSAAAYFQGAAASTASLTSAGTLSIAPAGATFTVTGASFTQTGGTTLLNGGTLAVNGGAGTVTLAGGTFAGLGTVNANLVNNATLSLGTASATGVLTVTGTYSQTGTLNLKVGGTAAGSQYDQLVINGAATFGGTLNVGLINGFTPAHASTYQIVKYQGGRGGSTFASTNFPGNFVHPLSYDDVNNAVTLTGV